MNADNFPFEEILTKSNSEDELIDNIRNICDSSVFKQIVKVFTDIGEVSQEKYDKLFDRKLKATWSMECAQDLLAIHNIDTNCVVNEIVDNAIKEIESK